MPVEPIEDAVMDRDVSNSVSDLNNAIIVFENEEQATINDIDSVRDAKLQQRMKAIDDAALETTTSFEKALDPNNPTSKGDIKELFDKVKEASKLDSIKDVIDASKRFETSPSGKGGAKVAKNTKIAVESLRSKVYEIVKKNLSKREMKDFDSARTDHEKASKDLEQALATGDPKKIAQAKKVVDNKWDNIQNMIEGSTECKAELESKLGNRIKPALKFLKNLALLGTGVLGLFLLGRSIVRDLDGCYQYNGTDSQKIYCPNDDAKNYCKCGDATPDLKSVTDLQDFCKNNPQYAKYPFCCAISPDHPTCSGAVGDKDSVYYTYKEFSILGLIAGIPGDIENLIKKGDNLVGDFFKQILNWLLIIFVILVVVYVIFIVGKIILEKMTQRSQSTSIKMSSLF